MKPQQTGIQRIINATFYSFQGLKSSWQSEAAIRQEVAALVVLIPLALWLDVSIAKKCLLMMSALLVLVVELLNTALETVVDRISADYHELSGKAKDVGSAAVFIAILNAITIWALILW